jgi:hypothetical protein
MGVSLLYKLLTCWLVVAVAGVGTLKGAEVAPRQPRAVVFWVNVDGMRGDYPARAQAPFLQRLAREGAFTTELEPVFPSLTFPTHISMATGVPVSGHGVPGNAFYDAEEDRTYTFPADSHLVRAEPIWITARRQGVRTAVIDWPMSHRQQGEVTADYFGQRYDGTLSDEQRLQNVVDIYLNDADSKPLQLVMGYVSKVDSVGHAHGPDHEETMEQMRQTDALLKRAVQQVIERFEQIMDREDELYILITTDHGMGAVHTLVNAEHMLTAELVEDVTIITSGPVANVFLNKLPEHDRPARRKAMLERLAEHDFARILTREQAAELYGYDDPTRVGDIIIELNPGHSFTRIRTEMTMPVTPRGPLGMHGQAADRDPDMLGFAVIWRYRQPIGGKDLGRVHQLQLHPTVAHLLGVDPASGATAGRIPLD